MSGLRESELIINPDGSIYHLHLLPDQVASTVILVGDPKRVGMIAAHFESIECKVANREFVTYTGRYRNKRISVMATGIGTDNIDIVLNELDALVNVDFQSRSPKETHTTLNIIRMGTTGAVQKEIPVNSFIASTIGLGLDGLIHFYKHPDGLLDLDLAHAFTQWTGWDDKLPYPYAVHASKELFDSMSSGMYHGITLTAPGFYGPQGRVLRLPLAFGGLIDRFVSFKHHGAQILNFEMETSALYALGSMLGHRTLTICLAIANRATADFNPKYESHVSELSLLMLDRIVENLD